MGTSFPAIFTSPPSFNHYILLHRSHSFHQTKMVNQKLTAYELKRLENIKRNDELLASLNIKSNLADLSLSAKRHRAESKSYKISPEKKPRAETPIVIRRSLRTQGQPPDSPGLQHDFNDSPKKSKSKLKSKSATPVTSNKSPRELVPISMRDANSCSESDRSLVDKILSVSKDGDNGKRFKKVKSSIDLDSMELLPENVARLVPNRILSVKFFPTDYMTMVVAGNKFGNLGFWNVDSENEDGVYMYHPHPSPVSSILIQPFLLNKIVTSCYDGQIRLLDIENEMFDLLHSSEIPIFSMSQRPNDVNNLYIGEGHGIVRVMDQRSPKTSFSWDLHNFRINSIDFNQENSNMMVTSSTDSTACIWDLRKIGKSKPKSLKLIARDRAIHSAYFSPSGSFLATTSLDDKIGVLGGTNYEDEFMINHNNQTGRWLSSFKGVWGWDDSYVFVGNMKRGVDIISSRERRLVTTLESPHMTAIPCRFEAHPCKPGMLAAATSGGQVYIWTS